jgi:large subunit ribosomal protein L6
VSRKGNMPIALPKGVEITVKDRCVEAKGSKGSLRTELAQGLSIKTEAGALHVVAENESRDLSRLHGLYRAILQNMVQGVSHGFEKRLEMIGVGYRAAVQGNELDVQVGYSHPTRCAIPHGIQVKVEKNTLIIISGIDRQVVGQYAAEVRATRPPEPYQGKGIRYVGEYVRRKAGKAAKSVKKAA